jgi:peptide deformylase
MIYPIVAYGHPTLKKRSDEIDSNYPNLKEVIENMFETMHEAVGVGLAAPQVNLPIRLFIIDADPYADEHPETEGFKKAFINPEIIEETGEEWEFNEACLSVPGLAEYVSRKPNVKIKYQDVDFNECIEEYDGMLARIIQHEYDHLNGVLFVDRVSSIKKVLIKNKLKDIINRKVNVSYKMIFSPIRRKK